MVGWGGTSGSSTQSKSAHKARPSTSGAAAINSLAKQYDKPVKWRLQGSLEQRIQAWYQPVVRSDLYTSADLDGHEARFNNTTSSSSIYFIYCLVTQAFISILSLELQLCTSQLL